MVDEGELYEQVGEVMIDFMRERPTTFPDVMVSKEDFWRVHQWKRALLFVFLTRFVYKMDGQVSWLLLARVSPHTCVHKHTQKQWRNFSLRDYKFCTRMFYLFKQVDKKVFENTPTYAQLPATPPVKFKRKTRGRGSHKRNKKARVEVIPSSSEVESPMKTVSIRMDTFTDDESDYEIRQEPTQDGAVFDSDDDGTSYESEEL